MRENEVVDLKLSAHLLKLMLDEKIPFERKKGKMDYLIRVGADVNANVYGKSLSLWVKELGDEKIIKYVKERGGVEVKMLRVKRDKLGKQFWDDEGEVKSFKEIKELVLMGANLGVKNNRYKHIWEFLSFEEMNDILKNLPKGYMIDGAVRLYQRDLTELPDFSKIKVGEYFDCSSNRLTSLEGAPSVVKGDFNCKANQLTSLEGAPKEVGGDFDCYNNQLTDLKGAPEKVGGYFNCRENQLTDLKGAPREIKGAFNCRENQLTTLEGAPSEVGGDFDCRYNKLTTLKGAPEKVGGDFGCGNNQLTDLIGAPEKVGRDFNCGFNQLTDLRGAPSEVGGDFGCSWNQLTSLEGKPKKIGGEFKIEDEVLARIEELEKQKKNNAVMGAMTDKFEM